MGQWESLESIGLELHWFRISEGLWTSSALNPNWLQKFEFLGYLSFALESVVLLCSGR